MAERLQEIDSHDAVFLLCHCFSIPKLMYFLRSAPCFKEVDILQQYDQQLRSSLENILNITLEEQAWEQSTLPVAKGGLGIRRASDLALPAFLASAHGAACGMERLLPAYIAEESYQEISVAESLWDQRLNNNAMQQPANKSVQAAWDAPLYEDTHRILLEDCSAPVEKARLLAIASEQASDWLNAIPMPTIGLKLDNNSLRVAVGLRLGIKLCEPHQCICGQLVDPWGRHGLSCKKAKGTNSRHAHVNDLIKRALATSGTPAVLEPAGLSRTDGKRPDGLTLYPWSGGRSVVWDYTCRDTLAQSHVAGTAKKAGSAALQAEDTKNALYQELTANYSVIPVAMETLGSWGPQGLKFIKEIGSRIAEATGEKRSKYFIFQAISMAVQRGNVSSILGTIPDAKKMEEVFYL